MKCYHKCLFVFLLFAGLNSAIAQKAPKFGYINFQQLVSAMPEGDTIRTKLAAFAKELSAPLETMQTEYNQKNDAFVKEMANLPELVTKTRVSDLSNLKQRMQAYEQSAQEEIQNKQNELLTVMYAKAQKAIEAVGKEGGFSAVYESSALLYNSPDFIDLMPLVKSKLGIANTPVKK
jgi:outer membrane protein